MSSSEDKQYPREDYWYFAKKEVYPTVSIIVNNEADAITSHKNTPWKKGFTPTDCNASFDKPEPIRKRTTTTPRFAIALITDESGAMAGT